MILLSNLNQIWCFSTLFIQVTHIDFFFFFLFFNPSSGRRANKCGQTERQTDIPKLISTFLETSKNECRPWLENHYNPQVECLPNDGFGAHFLPFDAVPPSAKLPIGYSTENKTYCWKCKAANYATFLQACHVPVQLRILVTPVVQCHVTPLVMRHFLSARASAWLHGKASGWFSLALLGKLPGWWLSTGLSD